MVFVVRHVIFDEAKKRYASRTDSFRFSEVRATDLDDLTARCRHCVLDPKPGASVRVAHVADINLCIFYIQYVCMYICMKCMLYVIRVAIISEMYVCMYVCI